jgi:hypothetical protein
LRAKAALPSAVILGRLFAVFVPPGGTWSDVLYAFAPQLAQNAAPVEGVPHDEHGAAMGCPVLGSNFGAAGAATDAVTPICTGGAPMPGPPSCCTPIAIAWRRGTPKQQHLQRARMETTMAMGGVARG